MKKLITLTLFVCLIAGLCSCKGNTKNQQNKENQEMGETSDGEKDKPNDKKIFPFKHGIIHQTSMALGMDLPTVIYFDKWGEWMATEEKSTQKMMGVTIETDKLTIVKGTTHWFIDFKENTCIKYEGGIASAGMGEAIGKAMAEGMMEGMEIKELGEETYLGYKCKKMHIKAEKWNMDATVLSYGNLTMKMEGTAMGMEVKTTVTKIEESAPPAQKFEVPAGMKVEESSEITSNLK